MKYGGSASSAEFQVRLNIRDLNREIDNIHKFGMYSDERTKTGGKLHRSINETFVASDHTRIYQTYKQLEEHQELKRIKKQQHLENKYQKEDQFKKEVYDFRARKVEELAEQEKWKQISAQQNREFLDFTFNVNRE